MTIDPSSLQQQWPVPQNPRPIVVIGCGGIVNDAHLPAYSMMGLPVVGVFDIDTERATATATRFQIPNVYSTIDEAVASDQVIFDVAVPPQFLCGILAKLPRRATVLMQKPMGCDLADAQRIHELCREKQLLAAVNFQLRFSPMMLVVRDLIGRGAIGPIVDLDVHLNYREPWEMFPFLRGLPRVELLIASIHYFDWIRSLLGNPHGVYARSISHPSFPGIEATRSASILDYGDATRCCLSLNNTWQHGPRHERCEIRIEGLHGAAVISLGCLVGYPNGQPDTLEFVSGGGEWMMVPLEGSWFPHAFRGPMCNLQRVASGEDSALVSSVDDALHTMKLIEALYESNEKGAVRLSHTEN